MQELSRMNNELPLYYKYWGKASKEDGSYHLLPYHCLDVAAVGVTLLQKHYQLRKHLSELSGLEEKELVKWVSFFLAIHDLGKFSSSFQNLREDIMLALQGRNTSKGYSLRHDSIGFLLWNSQTRSWLLDIPPKKKGRVRGGSTIHSLDYWAAAVLGHHGLPPKNEGRADSYYEECDRQSALEFCESVEGLILDNQKTIPQLDIDISIKFSWWLAGFAVLCDWLGSSQAFEYKSTPIELSDYWATALNSAESVIDNSELLPSHVAPLKSIQNLFRGLIKQPTPLQKVCAELSLANNPQLFILEDVTGAGKTEAALMLVHRLLSETGCSGTYFALPTMATANAMYERMAKVYKALYEQDTKPSLILAHGARELSAAFKQSIVKSNLHIESDYGDETEPAASHCSAWLADNRKKALLAEIGVGTIDQSLLAMLPSKHQSLRLLGLLGKVLVVDEVHACDAYVHELLCAVIKAHTYAGGSTILLSATLPKNQRQALLNAFYKGTGLPNRALQKYGPMDYPLITHSTMENTNEQIVATRESVKREVIVQLVHSHDEVYLRIEQAISDGKCVCWIRNTVDHARQAFSQLSATVPQGQLDLFHARFTMFDRLVIEERVLKHFGRGSTAEIRKGKALIATQVVEQSLDLDFDLLITDLAPIDLIIQRAGRLRRHTRDNVGNVIDDKDQRGTAVLVVNTPDPNSNLNSKWFDNYFERAGGVYPNHGQLWLGAKMLSNKGKFRMPEEARELIEGVYRDDVEIPEPLLEVSLNATGEASAERGLAGLNQLKLDSGYGFGLENRWWDEAITPTRLGEESTTVYLATWDGETLKPWAAGENNPWPQSALNVRKKLIGEIQIDKTISEQEINRIKEQLPAKGKWGGLLPVVEKEAGNFIGATENVVGKSYKYSKLDGFVVLEEGR